MKVSSELSRKAGNGFEDTWKLTTDHKEDVYWKLVQGGCS